MVLGRDLRQRVEEVADRFGYSASEVIRQCIDKGLSATARRMRAEAEEGE